MAKVTKEVFEKLCSLTRAMLDDKGREVLNPKPHRIHVGIDPTPTLAEQVARLVKSEISMQAQAQAMETFEEANDFEVDDGFSSPEFLSGYELMTDEFIRQSN